MRLVADAPGTSQEIDLRNYVDRILKRWWIVAICVVLAVVASFTITRTSNKNQTQATATVYLGQPAEQDRLDVGAVFGERFTAAGYRMDATLDPGDYIVVVFARSTVTSDFAVAQAIALSIR
jgi:LPS O-antigen subunit length determinant protein (WzzB/FepE family)